VALFPLPVVAADLKPVAVEMLPLRVEVANWQVDR
jgi:hypothetical protein